MGILVILLALGCLMFLAYRGLSLLLLAPAMAMLAVLLAEGGPLLASYTQVFMQATGGFIIQYFPLFLLGAVFGKLMEASGSAQVLANGIIRGLGPARAILAVILSCAAMTYGGVSLFVVAFAVWPIASALFREADLPKVLIPATIALGAFTFTMTALPGTPAIQNAIPMPYFGTTPFAAPGLGLITGALMLGLAAIPRARARSGVWGTGPQRHRAQLRCSPQSIGGGFAAGACACVEPCLHLPCDPGNGHPLSGAARIRRNRRWCAAWSVVDHRRSDPGLSGAGHHELAASGDGTVRDAGRRRQGCFEADLQHRKPCGLRCRDRLAIGLWTDPRLGRDGGRG